MKLFNIFLYSLIFFAVTSLITILYTPPTSQEPYSSSSSPKLIALIRMKKSARKSSAPPPPPPAVEPYDYLMLALTWPPGYCKSKPCGERVPFPPRFTLHGLWPGRYEGAQPRDCTKITGAFDSRNLDSHLMKNFRGKWPYLISDVDETMLWRNQWKYHGSCTGLEQKTYYELTMKMFDRVDMRAVLKSKGKEPTSEMSKTHGPLKRGEIAKALKEHFEFEAQLDCVQVDNTLYLMEVRLCYEVTDTEQMKDCPRPWTNSCFQEDIYFIL